MIIESERIVGIQTDLAYLDGQTSKLGFVRWQWEYTRATYDYKIETDDSDDVYYLRLQTRAIRGKLEEEDTVLRIEAVYMGKVTFPHGLDYAAPIPEKTLDQANRKLSELYQALKTELLVEDVMDRDVPRLAPESTLFDAARLMKTNSAGMVAVVADEQLVGVVTERDLAVRGYAEKQAETLSVAGVMSADFRTVEAELSVAQAVAVMVRDKLAGLPVVSKGSLVGMVTLDQLAAKQYFG